MEENQDSVTNELSNEDMFFYQMSALLTVLPVDVSQPVCIGSDYGGMGPFSRIYYDVEGRGPEIMRRRYIKLKDDIDEFMHYHRKFYDALKIMDIDNPTKNAIMLIPHLKNYVLFIDDHQKRTMDNYFLYQPTCNKGHLEVIGNKIFNLSFNPSRNLEGALEDINILNATIKIFANKNAPLNKKYFNILENKMKQYSNMFSTTILLLNRIYRNDQV
ncbi:MAG: hypothetical protein ACP5NV_00755 [Candidatus Woesearchaeota archaeon]